MIVHNILKFLTKKNPVVIASSHINSENTELRYPDWYLYKYVNSQSHTIISTDVK